MEDEKIIELFFQRDESAVAEAQCKYFSYCMRIAMNLLSDGQDAEECVNDTFYEAWKKIPPERPEKLKSWLGKIVHNISINRWKKNHTQKRYNGLSQALDELTDSIPSLQNMEQEVEDAEMGAMINQWLLSLSGPERHIFLRRYWYGLPLYELAEEMEIKPNKLAQQMYRLRQNLKAFLEKEEQLHG